MTTAAVWITRTEPAASRLVDACRDLKLTVLAQPLLSIEPLKQSLPDECFDLGVCVSVHAARLLAGRCDLARRWVCVGEETARALASSLGIATACVEHPEEATSEGLVAMLKEQLHPGETVVLACGIGGRGLLEAAIQAEDCTLSRLELYRRRKVRLSAVPEARVVEIASAQALEALVASPWDKRRAVVVASTRLADLAATKGFENVHNSGGAEAHRVAATLAAIARDR
ncbi:MAG: uroporphyrinogen-III synthase [Pseudomonadaceae bacterium]|nr:uroporphyrinogen-III synthase [Pseudomonadaceae bacterium]